MSPTIRHTLRKAILVISTIVLAIHFISAEPFSQHSIRALNKNNPLGHDIGLEIKAINDAIKYRKTLDFSWFQAKSHITNSQTTKNIFAPLKNSTEDYHVAGVLLGQLQLHRQTPLDSLTNAKYSDKSINQIKGAILMLNYLI